MNNTAQSSPRPAPRRYRAPGLRDASANEIFMDMWRIGPAPTRSRELFVMLVTVVILAALLFVFSANVFGFVVAFVLIALVFAVRWFVGVRTVWADR